MKSATVTVTSANATTSTNHILQSFVSRASQIVFGKEREIQLALTCLLARGHLLVEDVPGVGKTTLVKTIAQLLNLPLTRVQFTNDLLPGDLLGGRIFDPRTASFSMVKGPLFSPFVLADELNRATPKTQSACLQAMEERQISIDGETYQLPEPFFVIATQNPRQQIGTYPLPESQLDRFLMRIGLGYPDRQSEKRLLKDGISAGGPSDKISQLEPVFDRESLLHHQRAVDSVHLSDALVDYIQAIASKTRESGISGEGLSPRGALALARASRAWAYLQGRMMTLPEDVQAVTVPVLSHRLNPAEDPSGETGRRKAEDVLAQVKAI
ncbi:AAA family ATPase [soil metagenome]